MNEYDSALVESMLENYGIRLSEDKETADFLLINTCSVRQHAENRALANLSQYQALKLNRPEMRIALLGCIASHYGEQLLEQYPYLDFIVGPDGYRKLPEILMGSNGKRLAWMGIDESELYEGLFPITHNFSSYIAVTRGCSNFCSYCIVPYVRGWERSRSFHSIIGEAGAISCRGVKEIILIGQNVNSYIDQNYDFADLLRAVSEIEKVQRIRFITSHPKDLSDKLLRTMSDNPKIAPHLHLPLQSGSDRILKLMNRQYTSRHYLDLVERARALIPHISLTTDIIVGFPSETEAEYTETLDLAEQIRFDDAFTYRYSPRLGTKAARMTDDIPEEVKLHRLERLIRLTRKIARQNLHLTLGQVYSILIEKTSKKEPSFWMGRTEHNRVAVLPKGCLQPGQIISAKVEGITGFTLRCRPVD